MSMFKKKPKKKQKPQVKKVSKPSPKSRPQRWTPPFAGTDKRSSIKMIDTSNSVRQSPKPIEIAPTYTLPSPPKVEASSAISELLDASDPEPKETVNYKKNFMETFRKLTYRWRSWDIWTDFVTIAACAISNTVDHAHFDEREELYLRVINKYNKEEQGLFPELFAHVVMALEDNPEQDFLSVIYTELGLNSKDHQQIFTPYNICHMMAEMTIGDVAAEVEEKGFITIHDCCCGGGTMLIAAANVAKHKLEKVGLNFQNHILITGQDIDHTVAMMCYIQLSLLGIAGYFKVGSALTDPMTDDDSLDNYWFTPMYFFPTWTLRRIWRNVDRLMEERNDEASI